MISTADGRCRWERGFHGFLLAGLFCFTGCVGARLEYQAVDLVPATLQEGRTALGGVVAREGVGTVWAGEEAEIMNELEHRLSKKRGEAPLVRFAEFRKVAGPGRGAPVSGEENLVRARYRESEIERARRSGVTHFFLIELTGNELGAFVEKRCDHDTHYEYDDEGNVVRCWTETTYYTYAMASRSLEARYHLYDLATMQPVWVASSADADIRSNSRCSDACYPPPPPFPKPPSVASVLEGMTRAAVRELPKEERGWLAALMK